MADEEREAYSWDCVEIGMIAGSITALDQKRRSKKRHPIGFAAPARQARAKKGQRKPGTFPNVPPFDVL